MNKMADLAKLLGKELGEEFIAKYPEGEKKRCKFLENGLFTSDTGESWDINRFVLYDLFSGKCEIYNLPWKAKKLEEYYVPDPSMSAMYRKTKNVECCEDSAAYKRGFMCKTQEQAEMIARAIIKVACELQGFDDYAEPNNDTN